MLITLGLAATDPKGGSQMVSNIVKGINRPTDWGLVKAELHVWMLSMTSTHVFFFIKLQSFKPLNYKGYSEKSMALRYSQKMAVKGQTFCKVWIGLLQHLMFNAVLS